MTPKPMLKASSAKVGGKWPADHCGRPVAKQPNRLPGELEHQQWHLEQVFNWRRARGHSRARRPIAFLRPSTGLDGRERLGERPRRSAKA